MNTKKLRELRERWFGRATMPSDFAAGAIIEVIDAILEPEPTPEAVVGEHLDLIVDAYGEFRHALVSSGAPGMWPANYYNLPTIGKAAIDAFALRLIERVRSERSR